MKKEISALCGVVFVLSAAAADFWPETRFEVKSDGITEIKTSSIIYSRRVYPVNHDEKYILSGEFRAAPETVSSVFWFGLVPCDEKRRQFGPQNICRVKGTETVLTAPCRKNDRSILVKNADGWKVGSIYLAAFGSDQAGETGMLPNFRISSVGITAIKPENNFFRISFRGPTGQDCPAGTEVRMHQDAASAIWCGASRKRTTGEWRTFRGIISGNSGIVMNEKGLCLSSSAN